MPAAIVACLAIHLAALAAPSLAAQEPVEKPASSVEKTDAQAKDAPEPSPAVGEVPPEKATKDAATNDKATAASPKSPNSPDSAKQGASRNTSAAPKNTLNDIPSYGEALIRMLVVLASILIALLLLARYLPRWLGKSAAIGRGDRIKVIDSLALEPRKRIYLVKVGEQLFLIGTSESGVHMLADKAIDAAKLGGAAEGAEGAGDAADPGVMGSGPGPSMRTFAEALGSKPARPRESEGA